MGFSLFDLIGFQSKTNSFFISSLPKSSLLLLLGVSVKTKASVVGGELRKKQKKMTRSTLLSWKKKKRKKKKRFLGGPFPWFVFIFFSFFSSFFVFFFFFSLFSIKKTEVSVKTRLFERVFNRVLVANFKASVAQLVER